MAKAASKAPGKAKTSAKPASAPKAKAAKATVAESPPPPRQEGPGPEARGPASQRPHSDAGPEFNLLTAEQRQMMEAMSVNLAKAAMTAQGAIAEAALRQADRPAALSPDPFHVAPALTEVMGKLAAEPDKVMRAQADLFGKYMELWSTAAKRAMGEPAEAVAQPGKGDKRFNDPDWSANPVFDVMKQSYC